MRLLPQRRTSAAWALLKDRHPKEAALVVGTLREPGFESARLRIEARTSPLSASTAAEQAWLMRLNGNADLAKVFLDKRADAGVRLPAWGR